MTLELVRESFYLPPPPARPLRQYLSCWAKEPLPFQSLWCFPLPRKQAYVALCRVREDLGAAFRPGSLNGKTELCTELSKAPHSFLPRSWVSSANPQLCPAFPECCPKPSWLLLPTARSSALGLGWVGVVLVQFWKGWLTGVQHWKYLPWTWPCRAHPMWRKQFLSESPKPGRKSDFIILKKKKTFQLLPDCCNFPVICCIIVHPRWGGTGRAALLFNHLPSLLTCG